MALDVPDEHGEGFYMIAVNRARTRSLTGFLRSMVRSTVQGRSRDAMRRILSATKAALESEAPAAAGAPARRGRQRAPGAAAGPAPPGATTATPRTAS